jgi:hypothetical protein
VQAGSTALTGVDEERRRRRERRGSKASALIVFSLFPFADVALVFLFFQRPVQISLELYNAGWVVVLDI